MAFPASGYFRIFHDFRSFPDISQLPVISGLSGSGSEQCGMVLIQLRNHSFHNDASECRSLRAYAQTSAVGIDGLHLPFIEQQHLTVSAQQGLAFPFRTFRIQDQSFTTVLDFLG